MQNSTEESKKTFLISQSVPSLQDVYVVVSAVHGAGGGVTSPKGHWLLLWVWGYCYSHV